ncbi:MAG TPA: serine hydrolase domain-containing protein [Verrucomicrobiota bacterium]|nr:serine hydrolase domain-containing protein [Verrucomicrobiota bacterium]
MNDDALKQLWKGQGFDTLPALPDEAQIAAMKTRMKGFDRTISWRDYREVAACILIIGWFGWDLLFGNNSTLTQAGCVVLIASAVFIAWKLIWSKRRLPKAESNAPIFDAVKVELQKVENQIGLLKSVAWWYLLPLLVGVMMCHWGGSGSVPSKLTYSAFVLALFYFIYWLNRRAVKNYLLPLKRELASLLHSAETGEPLDQTQIANLRRIAFSITAASHVKPVEFKVAFWQLAIYGVPGIVGIWFFWMLARTEGNIARIFLPEHLLWGVLSFLGGLIYTWLIQKTVKRAVGISALGIHLQNGMNLILWDEIKKVRPFRFLNIQNLWLIKESGEKTRMHWTPLERHSDLKAAVENFSPANHPIRQYLSLLRSKPSKKSIMTKVILIGIVLITLGAIVFVQGRNSVTPTVEYSDPVSQALETIRVKHKLPALAAAVVVDGKVVATNAVGFRKSGATEAVTVNDKFHIGSVTKSMTATVAAMLVEQGKISWKTTIGEAFPELKSEIHSDYLGVTLEQLLSHRGGAPGDAPGDLWVKAWAAKGTAAGQRLAFIKGILSRKPEAKPGTKYVYSNQGYTIAGVMLEKAAGKTWEDLLRSMLFEPLGMTTARFGAPASIGKVDQPWGHAKALAVPPGPRADNPLAISPAGAVHCSVGDLAKYAAFHMAGERGESKSLSAESFGKLHTALADNNAYALGWIEQKRPWAKGRALVHGGSNTMFYVVVWLAPEINCAVIVASNAGVDAAFAGCDEAAIQLIQQYFPK